jgi:hypothetical protein
METPERLGLLAPHECFDPVEEHAVLLRIMVAAGSMRWGLAGTPGEAGWR